MTDIKVAFPLLARHEGVWDGMYRTYDASGDKIDEHRSRLICRFPTDGPFPYHQSNHYSWADGRTDQRDFPAVVSGDRITFVSDLIDGWASDVKLDTFNRTTMLNWVRLGEPGTYLYEMIQISDCGNFRSRTWHWFREGRCFQRTLIDEQRVSHQWRGIAGASYAGDPLPA